MKSFLQRLLNTGITPGLSSHQTRTINFLNTFALLVVFLISMNTLFLLTQTPLTYPGKVLIAVSAAHALLLTFFVTPFLRQSQSRKFREQKSKKLVQY